jgi:hypothetical protein
MFGAHTFCRGMRSGARTRSPRRSPLRRTSCPVLAPNPKYTPQASGKPASFVKPDPSGKGALDKNHYPAYYYHQCTIYNAYLSFS